MDYTYLALLAIILVSTKALGLASEKIHMPQVVGALLAGIILGPSGFGVMGSTDFLVKTAEIGVIMLMFTAGIDTDMTELKRSGAKATVIAVAGVFVPLVLCGGLYFLFFCEGLTAENLLRAAFVGGGLLCNVGIHYRGNHDGNGEDENLHGNGPAERSPDR